MYGVALDELDELSVSQGLVVVKKKPCLWFRLKRDWDFSSELKVRSGLTSLQVTSLNYAWFNLNWPSRKL